MKLTSLADALETHRVIFAADESARTGRPVTLV
jgi:predicted dehydrogenase